METDLKVSILGYTKDGEELISSAARLCYSPDDIKKTREKLDDDKIEKFIKMLMEMGHESPIEHISFTFGIEGVSRSLLAQITRHRIASFSVKSQRYVKEGQFQYVVPSHIKNNPEAKEIYLESMSSIQKAYDRIASILEKKHYHELIKNGKNEKAAKRDSQKKAIEDARYVLPNSCETKIIMTMNARSLLNFFQKRCCMRAQWEIRHLADEMLKIVRQKAPSVFNLAGPSCFVYGKCPEKSMNCGEQEIIKERFNKNDPTS